MYQEKYKKYKLKYKLLKKRIAKLGLMNGGDRFSESKHFNSNLNYVVQLLNGQYGSDWAFTGSTAVVLLARDQDVLDKFPELNFPNDYDVLIQNNSPIASNTLGALEKIPEQRGKIISSVTFQGYANNDRSDETNKVSLDVTYLDRAVRIKMHTTSNKIRVVHPTAISSSYEDELMMGTSKNPESDTIKKRVLDEVIKKLKEKEVGESPGPRRFRGDSDESPAGGAGAESTRRSLFGAESPTLKKNLFGDD